MSGARDHLDHSVEQSGRPSPRPADPSPTLAIAGPADPRLEHGGVGAAGDLLHLQRTVGNAAVSSLVGAPAVQRVVAIDEATSSVDAAPPGVGPQAVPEGGGSGPVTSDGGTTTITGGSINLAAPITQSDGVIRADTIIADSVIASSYTPGAGNVW